jgi:DNA-binding CsgD family transcriptional regulator
MGGLIRLGPNRDFDGFHYVVNAGYPDEWVKLYYHHGLAECDPMLKTTLRAPGTYHWRAIYQSLSSEQDWSFIAAAQGFGLHDGITMGSADQADGLIAICAFATDREFDATRVLPLAQYLGHFMLKALRRIAPPVNPPGDRLTQNLSPRELTVLIWMTRGKTNLEIGRILGVRERTIRFHVERIFAKLDVTSRSQAVAVALEERLPDFGSSTTGTLAG